MVVVALEITLTYGNENVNLWGVGSMVEQLAVNQWVVGSNPALPAMMLREQDL